MKNHTQNLFRVNNLFNLDFSYKLVEIDLPDMPNQSMLYNTALQRIQAKIASEIGGPAAIVFRNGKHFIAIPGNKNMPDMKIQTNPFSVSANATSDIFNIDLRNIDANSNEIMLRFLDFDIKKQLKDSFGLWEINSHQFFLKAPVYFASESNIEVYGGFRYRLIPQEDGQFYISLDLAYKYLDKFYLSENVNGRNVHQILPQLKGRKCLYQNGDNWYSVEIAGFGKKLSEHEVLIDNKPVVLYDYITSKTQQSRFKVNNLLSPEHLALLYTYPGRTMEPHHGATSLAKLVYNTNDQGVKALHKLSIKAPDKKFDYICSNINKYFTSLSYNGASLKISGKPQEERERFFFMPDLKGNNNKVLSVKSGDNGNTALKDYGAVRKKLICDNGILNHGEFDNQYLIVPNTLDKSVVEAFKKHALNYLKKLAPSFSDFKIITYAAKPHLAATIQVQEIDAILTKHNAKDGFALFILPDIGRQSNRSIKNFHDCLKNKFFPDLKFQCASAYKIKSFYRQYPSTNTQNAITESRLIPDMESSFKSYLFNLMTEYLLVNRKWPYALVNNLHYDVYIGIDVHDRYAGFTFFYKNGEHIFFDHKRVPKKASGNRAEKLKKGLITEMLLKKLEAHLPKYAPNPNGIVIVRDGKSFGEEHLALDQVIEGLAAKGLINPDTIKSGVVDLHKQSAIPLRIATITTGFLKLENPRAGSYKLIQPNEGFLFNTGYPFSIRGTAKPLQLILQHGNTDFKKIMEDLFAQSMLAFSAPDRSNSLPIVIKLIDTFLEPLTTAFEDEISEEEEIEDLVETA